MDNKVVLLLVVTGFPRSGTTLLNQILSSHPDIEVSFEFHSLNVPLPYDEYVKQLRHDWWQRRLLRWHGSFPRQLSVLKSAWFYYRYRFLLRRYAQQNIDAEIVLNSLKRLFPEKRYLGDKFPYYTNLIAEHSRISFARRLVIYRDVRHVVPSFQKMFGSDNEAGAVAKRWAVAMALVEEYRDSLHLIRYEDLLKNPKETLQAIADYLEISPDGFRHNHIRTDNDGDFRKKLSEAELVAIEEAAGEQMRKWGYL